MNAKLHERFEAVREDYGEHAGAITAMGKRRSFVIRKQSVPVLFGKVRRFHHPAMRQVADHVEAKEPQVIQSTDGQVVFHVDRSAANALALPNQAGPRSHRDMVQDVVESNRIESIVFKAQMDAVINGGFDGQTRSESVNHVNRDDLATEMIVHGLRDGSVSPANIKNATMAFPCLGQLVQERSLVMPHTAHKDTPPRRNL